MSDRTRGAVRTGAREGAGVAEAADLPAEDGRPAGGATKAGGASRAGGPGNAGVAASGGVAAAGSAAPDGAAAPPQPTLAGGAAAGAARPDAPLDGPPPVGGPATGSPAQRPAKGSGGKVRTAAGRGRGPRRARLQLRHIDTWSALKISLVVSIALFFVWMVAVGVLFGVLNGLGVFDTLNDLFGQLGSVSGAEGAAAEGGSEVISAGVVFGGAAVIGLINIVLMTALCTVGAVVYNLCSDLVGGVEVTLSERD